MTPGRKLNRRSFLARVAGGSALAGGALLFVSGRAEAFQCSDNDSGAYADRAGAGRRCADPDTRPPVPNTGVTDSDSADPVNGGRRRRTGCSDNDRGNGADPGGWGVRCRPATGVTDSDSSDPVNGGRRRRSGCSDSDRGTGADPGGWGVRCRPATGYTDNDSTDPANGGQGYRNRGCSDSDSGSYADNAG